MRCHRIRGRTDVELAGDLARLTARAAAKGCDVIASLPQGRPNTLPLRRADRGALLPGVLVDRTVGIILDLIGTNPDFRLLRDAFV